MRKKQKTTYLLIAGIVLALIVVGVLLIPKPTDNDNNNSDASKTECKELTYHGKTYETTKIGDTCWMAEDLVATKYRDETDIPWVVDNKDWNTDKEGARGCYNNKKESCKEGVLYNWHAVDNKAKLCPKGWHVPTDEEWTDMEVAVCNQLGNQNCQEEFSNEKGMNWRGTNEGDELKSGSFGGILFGFRNSAGPFSKKEESGFWWTATESNDFAIGRSLSKENDKIRRIESSKNSGFLVRCVESK